MKLKLVVVDLELSKRAKRIAAAALVPVLVLAGGAIAYANQHTWKDGDTLDAADLNGNFADHGARLDKLEQAVHLAPGSNAVLTGIVGGDVNPSTTPMLWQSASTTVMTDANGIATITYPSPFANGVLNVVLTDGFADFGPLVYGVKGAGATQSKGSFQAIVYRSNGSVVANSSVRFNWLAIGW